ncbi:hypothetical protein CEUSTIGMA_g1915.t1 [Chlamydomonas eustigma]|uniref:Ureidoglycolate hydrolase n=1 Tax=Chlamydomonas eustigma TaxID=1157962 RepID=A0A250WUM9_9CHLO|nr:hypothetical protein CEUSTIGMA_g1915.t1 [Chlamydomonas eustigma]|eukprot:GAX74466.1 hypothetical protein CEUSTIGMA_g1915.t1 [Chlamydomonas eustigma]
MQRLRNTRASEHVRPGRARLTIACVAVAAGLKLPIVKYLQPQRISAETFKPFGQVIGPTADGKEFDAEDAQLVLDKGTPRFYIMRLPKKGLRFHRITYHAQCTQCLGSLQPMGRWFLAVAAPTMSVQQYPKEKDITVFEIPHGCFVKMKEGTWHAGPLFFESEYMDFYNLELNDTNVVDHNTHDYRKINNIQFDIMRPL